MPLWYPDSMLNIGSRPTGKALDQQLPWCLCAEDAARYLGWPPYFMTLLARAGHIKPLGRPAQNSRKWYATVELARLGQDPAWLDKAIRIVDQRAREANSGPKGRRRAGPDEALTSKQPEES